MFKITIITLRFILHLYQYIKFQLNVLTHLKYNNEVAIHFT
jgi:hypothetical protein